MENTTRRLRKVLKDNSGKITLEFIENEIETEKVKFFKLTANTRVCVIKTKGGHEVVGIAQVLDSINDVEEIGNEVAYKNAVDNLWNVYGSIAKVIGEF